MELITLEVTETTIIVKDGRMKGARLRYRAPGLEIYVKGSVTVRKRDSVHYHACQQAIIRHIPLIQLVKDGAL